MSFKDGDLHVKVDELEKQVEKLKVLNGELCAEVNEKDERIRELELRIELSDKAQTARDNGYTEGFDNGVKACLQQLEGIFMNAGGIIDVEDWVSKQWKEYES